MTFWQTFIKPTVINDHQINNDFIFDRFFLAEDIRYHLEKMIAVQAPLLNIDQRFKHVNTSVLGFGIDNIIRMDDSNELLVIMLEKQIKCFEKRIDNIKVHIIAVEKNIVEFAVTAHVKHGQIIKEVSFNSNLGLNDLLKKELSGALND